MRHATRSIKGALVALLGLILGTGVWLWHRTRRAEAQIVSQIAAAPAQPNAISPVVPGTPGAPMHPERSEVVASSAALNADSHGGSSGSSPEALPATAPANAHSASDSNNEMQATLRMFSAHAPLRMRELADPGSETNRATVQTMLVKALKRAQTGQPKN